ncbi:uncharacterized protein LOC113350767 [Papaver somniferum]|uniref:uncharacterized protein LOC113350767 n=1 Tax=Papaver somniferum TaxID=3469 RepID=UPI000E702B8D|nr:uncharacterized protein LOC113350767 [Papaver somniferum]
MGVFSRDQQIHRASKENEKWAVFGSNSRAKSQSTELVKLQILLVETDEAEDHKRRKDRIQRKILAAEERRRFVDGVPSDSDADASEEETTWVLPERKIKSDRRTRELQNTMKRVEVELEAEAEEYSDSDDPHTHTDFINGPDSDSDEEEDSEKDSDDESDSSDASDE